MRKIYVNNVYFCQGTMDDALKMLDEWIGLTMHFKTVELSSTKDTIHFNVVFNKGN